MFSARSVLLIQLWFNIFSDHRWQMRVRLIQPAHPQSKLQLALISCQLWHLQVMVSRMIFATSLINSETCASLAGLSNISGTSPSLPTPTTPTTPNNILDLSLSTTADKAVKAILPFLKELSETDWWTGLLTAWINFEAKGPLKSVSSFDILFWYVLKLYIIATPNKPSP